MDDKAVVIANPLPRISAPNTNIPMTKASMMIFGSNGMIGFKAMAKPATPPERIS